MRVTSSLRRPGFLLAAFAELSVIQAPRYWAFVFAPRFGRVALGMAAAVGSWTTAVADKFRRQPSQQRGIGHTKNSAVAGR